MLQSPHHPRSPSAFLLALRNSFTIAGKKHSIIRVKSGRGKRDQLHNYYTEAVKCDSLYRFSPFPEESLSRISLAVLTKSPLTTMLAETSNSYINHIPTHLTIRKVKSTPTIHSHSSDVVFVELFFFHFLLHLSIQMIHLPYFIILSLLFFNT